MALRNLSRRDFLRNASVVGSAALLSACAPKVVEKVVKQTVVVEKEVVKEVPKEVTVKETVIVAGTPKTVEKVVTTTPAPQMAATVVLWTYPYTENDNVNVFDPLNAIFNNQYPKVKMEVDVQPWGGRREKLYTAFAAGSGPDLFDGSSDTVPVYLEKGIALPLEDLLPKEAIEGFLEMHIGFFTGGGHVVGTPKMQFCDGPGANLTMMTELGKDPTVFPVTWDDMYELGDLAKAKGWYADEFSSWGWDFWMNIVQAGGTMYSEDGKKSLMNTQPVIDALTHIVKMFDLGYFPKEGAVNSAEAAGSIPDYFMEQLQVGNFEVGPTACVEIPKQVPSFALVPAPARSKDASHKAVSSNSGCSGWCISKNSKNVEASATWIAFMNEPSNMGLYHTLTAGIPPKEEARKYWKAQDCVMEWVAWTAPTNFFIKQDAQTLWQEGKVIFAPHAQAAILHVETVEEALDGVTKEIQAILDKQA